MSSSSKKNRFKQKLLPRITHKKREAEKQALKTVLNSIRTDRYDQINNKELKLIIENYRIEAIDLLECVSFLLRIAQELEKIGG